MATLIDAFTFFGSPAEFDLLDLRLQETYERMPRRVDATVIVEGGKTFSGNAKAYNFAAARERYKAYPITYVTVNDMPSGPDAWGREAYQRNCILRGVEGADDDAVIMVSDVDEIPNMRTVAGVLDAEPLPHNALYYLDQDFYYYSFNQLISGRWFGPRLCTYRSLRAWTPQGVRQRGWTRVGHGGWHFSYFGDNAAIAAKLKAFSHTEYDRLPYTDPAYIAEHRQGTVDLFGRAQNMELLSNTRAKSRLPETIIEAERAHRSGSQNGLAALWPRFAQHFYPALELETAVQ